MAGQSFARRSAAAAVAVAACAVLLLVVALMIGGGVSGRLLGVRIRVNDLSRPLEAAALLSAAFTVLVWRWRTARAFAVALLAACGLLALVALAREARITLPAGDVAVIESYVFHALDGTLLLGPYSRFQWHHPGPLYFFVLAPFYVLSGYRTSGLAAAALAINLAALVSLAWIALRAARGSFAIVLTALSVAYVARIGVVLASQWNPHVLVLPTLAILLLLAAVAAGWTALLPLAAALAAFAVQTHLGLAPTLAAAIGCAVALGVVGPFAPRDAGARRRLWLTVNVSLWVTLLLWFLPLAEEVSRTPGNLTKLWRFFLNSGGGVPFAAAFQAWAGALSGLIRPDFVVAWGGPLTGGGSPWIAAWAVAQVLLLAASAALEARRLRRAPGLMQARFHVALPLLLALASLAALWSVTRIAGEIVDHEVFWISALGVLNTAVIIDALLTALWPKVGAVPMRTSAFACGALLMAALSLGVSQLQAVNDRSLSPGNDEVAAETLGQEIVKYAQARPASKLRLDIDGPAWPVAAGVIVELQKAKVPFTVREDAVWMFGEMVAPRGDESSVIAISAPVRHRELSVQPSTLTIAERRDYFADVVAP